MLSTAREVISHTPSFITENKSIPMSNKNSKSNPSAKEVSLSFLGKTIASLTPSKSTTSEDKEQPPAKKQKNDPKGKAPATPPPIEEEGEPSNKNAMKAQKEKAMRKKDECVYRGFTVEKGPIVSVVQGKEYVEKVTLVDDGKYFEGGVVKEEKKIPR